MKIKNSAKPPIDRLQIMTFIIGVVLVMVSSVTIYLSYGDLLFYKWPWIRLSLVMATLTCLWTYTFCFFRVTGGNKKILTPAIFGIVVVPVDIMLVYPGAEALGVYGGLNIYTTIVPFMILHSLGFYFLQKEIQRYLNDFKN